MACTTTLGKRTRSQATSCNDFIELPAKRRRRVAPAVNDENQDPKVVVAIPSPDADTDTDTYTDLASLVLKTPSKIQRQYPVTPSTPRHRDVFANQPSTPRHAVMSAGKLFKRLTPMTPLSPSTIQTVYHTGRQLFARSADPGQLVGRENERGQLDAFLSRVDTPSPGGCLYVSGPPGTGKSAMVQSATGTFADRGHVRRVYVNCMSIRSSKDLYSTILSGLVGPRPSGMEKVEEDEDQGEQTEDGEEQEEAASPDAATALRKMFTVQQSGAAAYLVVLDEIDHVLTMGLDSLYRVFEWSLQAGSRLCLVGIANALDLTDRHLPRLKSRNLKPDLLPFAPYSAAQIRAVITTRLRRLLPDRRDADGSGSGHGAAAAAKSADYVPLIHPAAVELCSRKVAGQTGDLRKAFEICRRSLDLVEAETRDRHEAEARETMLQMTPSRRRAPLGENMNSASPPSKASSQPRSVAQLVANTLGALTADSAPRASIGHLNKVTAAAFGNGTGQRLKALNLQQKAALCALLANEKRTRTRARATTIITGTSGWSTPTTSSTPSTPSAPSTPSKKHVAAPTVKMLFDAYTQLCTRDSVLHPLSASEFREVVGSLEALGLVQAVDGRTGSLAAARGTQTPGRGRGGTRAKTGFPIGDERRLASCVDEKEVDGVVDGGVGEGILRSILSGEALDY